MLLVDGHNTGLACIICHASIIQGMPGEGGMHMSAQARDQLVMLSSFEPPPARMFAWRQLRLMRERGLTRRQAQRAVEAREAQEGAKR